MEARTQALNLESQTSTSSQLQDSSARGSWWHLQFCASPSPSELVMVPCRNLLRGWSNTGPPQQMLPHSLTEPPSYSSHALGAALLSPVNSHKGLTSFPVSRLPDVRLPSAMGHSVKHPDRVLPLPQSKQNQNLPNVSSSS